MRQLCCAVLPLMLASISTAQPSPVSIDQLGGQHELIGELNHPLGKVITIAGVAVGGPFKGYDGGPNIRVQRIQGRYTQQHIQIPLEPYFYDWGEKTRQSSVGISTSTRGRQDIRIPRL